MANLTSAVLSGNKLTFTFDENMFIHEALLPIIYTTSGTVVGNSGATGVGTKTWVVTLTQSFSSTDSLVIDLYYGSIYNAANQYLSGGTLVVGTSSANVMDIDFDQFGSLNGRIMYLPGNGADTVYLNWGGLTVNLKETTKASDTVIARELDFDDPLNDVQIIQNFDVSGTTTNDKLSFVTNKIAANITKSNGVDAGTIAKHTIANGIATFYTTADAAITIDTTQELTDAYNYLNTNLAVGTTAAFQAKVNGVTNLMVEQKSPGTLGSQIVALQGLSGKTLSTTAGTNKVQLVDKLAPQSYDGELISSGVKVYFSETVTSINASGIKLLKNGTTSLSSLSTKIDGATVTFSKTGTTFAATDFVVIDATGMTASTVAKDAAGNSAQYLESGFKVAIGGSGDNTIILGNLSSVYEALGGAGNDIIKVGVPSSKNYYMEGGAGDDSFGGAGGYDYFDGGSGSDTVMYKLANQSVKINLATEYQSAENNAAYGDTLVSIENVYGSDPLNNGITTLFGDTITGNSAANKLWGFSGNDILNGACGNDGLFGGLGNDTLTGGSGYDAFLFDTALNASTNKDTITDFSHTYDTIKLDDAIFKKLTSTTYNATTKVLNTANFSATGKAVDANDYIIYNKTTGALYYDADGSGAGAAVQFALLGTKPQDVDATDFVIY